MIFFGALVLLHDWKSLINKTFAVMMFGSLGWALANMGTFNFSPDRFESVLNAALIFASIQTLSGSAFVYLFPKPNFSLKPWHKVVAIVFSLIFLGVSPLQYDVNPSVTYLNSNIPIAEPNVFNVIWGIGILAQVIFTIAVTVSKYRKAEGDGKRQLGYILIGSSATFVLLFVSQYLTVNVLKTPILNSYGPLFMMPLILGTSYAITRYHLFSVKAITTEITTFILWLFLLLRILFDESLQDYFVDGTILLGVIIVGIFLIKSVLKEVRQKERLAELNAQLDKTNASLKDLNEHLEQKVAEQTVEIRKAYEVEKKARIELVELDKAKDQFILTTQHHLRTPLTIVKGYIQSFITKKGPMLDEEAKSYVTKASEAADEVGNLVNEFLDISQMEIGKSMLNKTPTDIKSVIQGILISLEPLLQAKRLKTSLSFPENNVIAVDLTKMKEALTDLIDNAIQYNQEGGSISIRAQKMSHPIEKDKLIYRLTIGGTGVGISPEKLQTLLVRSFQRDEEAIGVNANDRGIGLIIARNIIQAHGGVIYAESDEKDKGTKFVVELPV
ncbi:MAG: hypothetical protein HYR95_02770 [Candidatus Colwellbacteria bacterium]|nr:hypothetical protein [Candidatus Colwellbacteria bacterium]